jgi:hypothetical protein
MTFHRLASVGVMRHEHFLAFCGVVKEVSKRITVEHDET